MIVSHRTAAILDHLELNSIPVHCPSVNAIAVGRSQELPKTARSSPRRTCRRDVEVSQERQERSPPPRNQCPKKDDQAETADRNHRMGNNIPFADRPDHSRPSWRVAVCSALVPYSYMAVLSLCPPAKAVVRREFVERSEEVGRQVRAEELYGGWRTDVREWTSDDQDPQDPVA